ncbi:conserved hypothetical protein [Neospora caninum Liverpool]|uniref:Uncharacterized protein n=1 Tax=Neospora caninum (strain Liverpool) TaxID=572307 RepID=F0VCK0_NEOCL|nr:conserved hypothetical protein [Neospora caninum Liverpool]CBZ51689.1 conserved hypothetical protein [Neospora caninum Liverpool]|eukprot:XP_003881722.1 conserved hypothetical protein [Neospora caninum Liverpool]
MCTCFDLQSISAHLLMRFLVVSGPFLGHPGDLYRLESFLAYSAAPSCSSVRCGTLSPASLQVLRASVNYCLKEKRVQALQSVVFHRIAHFAPSPVPPSCSSPSCSPFPERTSSPPSIPPASRSLSSPSGPCAPLASSSSGVALSAEKSRKKPRLSLLRARRRPFSRELGTLPASSLSSFAAPSPGLHPQLLREAVVLLKRVADYAVPVRLLSLPSWEREQRRAEEARERRRQGRLLSATSSAKQQEANRHDGNALGEGFVPVEQDGLNRQEALGRKWKDTPETQAEPHRAAQPTASSASTVLEPNPEKDENGKPAKRRSGEIEGGGKETRKTRKASKGVPWGAPQWIAGGHTKSVWDGCIKETERFNWWVIEERAATALGCLDGGTFLLFFSSSLYALPDRRSSPASSARAPPPSPVLQCV